MEPPQPQMVVTEGKDHLWTNLRHKDHDKKNKNKKKGEQDEGEEDKEDNEKKEEEEPLPQMKKKGGWKRGRKNKRQRH